MYSVLCKDFFYTRGHFTKLMLLEIFKVWEQYFSSDSYIVGFSVQAVALEDGFLHKSTSTKNSLEALPKKSDRSENGDIATN